jgi:HK97 family phage major capsid protein
MNLKQQREAALKAARDIAEKAKGENRDLTAEEITEVDQHLAKADDLKAQIERSEKSTDLFARLESVGGSDAAADALAAQAKTLGEHFISLKGKDLLATKGVNGATVSAPEWVPAKAAADTQARPGVAGPWGTEYDPNLVLGYRRPLVIADLLASGTLTGNAITYLIEGALEGDFSTVAEGGAKPQIHFADPTQVTETLKKIAAFIKFTDEMIEDFAFIVSNINNRGLYQLGLTEEAQILNGDGTGQNLLGLLKRSGIQTEAATDAADNADAIFRAITKVQTATGFAADGLVIHPLDYQNFRLQRDGNGQYYGGGFFLPQYGEAGGSFTMQPPLWGLRTVVTPAVEQGTVALGAFKQAGTLYRKGGVRVESTNSHASDFTSNLVTTRIEERVALEVKYPAALVDVTLAA